MQVVTVCVLFMQIKVLGEYKGNVSVSAKGERSGRWDGRVRDVLALSYQTMIKCRQK